jgi:hypothetical protein
MRAAKSNLVAGAREQKSPIRKRAKKFACAHTHTQHTGVIQVIRLVVLFWFLARAVQFPKRAPLSPGRYSAKIAQ